MKSRGDYNWMGRDFSHFSKDAAEAMDLAVPTFQTLAQAPKGCADGIFSSLDLGPSPIRFCIGFGRRWKQTRFSMKCR